jgi:CheY-like chemotaxis protein
MGKKILLADDSITIQKVIELTFSDEDFDVVTVGNGRLAIERIQETRPDIVLCDIVMPEKDGYEVCDFVKHNPATANVPVLLLTGAFEPFDQERAARVGSDGQLAKPFEPQTLISKVKELLARPARPVVVPTVPPPPPPSPAPARHAVPPPPPAAAAPQARPSAPPRAAPVSPAPSAASREADVTFIPETPFGQEEPAVAGGDFATDQYTAPMEFVADSISGIDQAAVLDEDFYQPVAEPAEEAVPELATMDEGPAEYAPAAGTSGRAGQASPWPTAEVSWEDRAQAVAGTAAPYEDVFEVAPGGEGQGSAPAVDEPRLFEPALEYEPTLEPEPAPPHGGYSPVRPQPAEGRNVSAGRAADSGPSMVDLFAEQAAVFDDEPAATPQAAASAGPTPVPKPARSPAATEASFADLRVTQPQAADEPPVTASLAAEVGVPADKVAQIAQRVVGQMSEKVIREIAWEVVPDLAEAMIKREIEKLTAELKEP